MKIAHVSDLHIRNFKYRDEYNAAFDELYGKLNELQPDLIVNTGDTVHSKLAVSPELFDDVALHLLKMSNIAPYWVILGNHDLNLKNKTRMDAISPIVRALQGRTVHELRMPEPSPERMLFGEFNNFVFWNHDIRGHENFSINHDDINIGMYHGSISGCVTDIGFVIEDGEAEVSKFDSMDYVLMGDIHKRQSFRKGRLQYPGSLIQQNYGEELEKGFLLWEINSKDSFTADFHAISKVPGRFFTVKIPDDLDLSGVDVPQGSRIRAMVSGELPPSKRWELEQAINNKFSPAEVITPDSSGDRITLESPDIDDLVGSREDLMRDHLKERGLDTDSAEAVIKLFLEYEKGLDIDDSIRGTTWQLKRMSWDNMMNYGDGNSIDVTKLKGLVGVFAPNAAGKSSVFDILLQALFDKLAKDVPRNIDLVNDNKDSGRMAVEFESGGKPFLIERTIERIHYGQRKLSETKQWGKTSLEFSSVDDSLNGTSRPETERAIRSIIGNFEDFALTTMVSQNPIFGLPGGGDIINCRETDRRKILFRFLDLDIFEKVNHACKEELKGFISSIKGRDYESVASEIEDIDSTLLLRHTDLAKYRSELESAELAAVAHGQKLLDLGAGSITDLMRKEIPLNNTVVKLDSVRNEAKLKLTSARDKLNKAINAQSIVPVCPEKPSIGLEELTEQMENLRTSREKSRLMLSTQNDALARGKKSLVTLDDVPCGDMFPSCRFIAEASGFLTQRSIVESAIAVYESAIDKANQEFSTLEEYDVMHRDVVKWEKLQIQSQIEIEKLTSAEATAARDLDDAVQKYNELKNELDEIKQKIDPVVHSQIQAAEDKIELLSGVISEAKNSIESLLRSIGAIDSKKQDLSNDLAELGSIKKKVGVYEQLVELTGKNGLPYRILAMVLPVINDEISKILTGIVKFNVFFEDDPDEQTVSLYIRYGDYKSRPLSLGSGAEKFIASLAIRVATLSVSSLPKTDLLIVDEGFGKLDPEHLEALQKMFEYLKEAFGTVFIISHVDSMRDTVDHSLEITSLDGYAHLESL